MLKRTSKVLVAVAAFAALALGASAIAGAASQQSTTSNAATPQSGSAPNSQPRFNGPAPGTAAHEDAEKPVTGAAATKARAAAVKAVGSGTAGAVTTDFTGDGYETTVIKADGTKVAVHLDKSFAVIQGHGPGDPGGPPGG
jgi:hypothetical protein